MVPSLSATRAEAKPASKKKPEVKEVVIHIPPAKSNAKPSVKVKTAPKVKVKPATGAKVNTVTAKGKAASPKKKATPTKLPPEARKVVSKARKILKKDRKTVLQAAKKVRKAEVQHNKAVVSALCACRGLQADTHGPRPGAWSSVLMCTWGGGGLLPWMRQGVFNLPGDPRPL